MNAKYKWTKEDNAIGEAEVKLSNLLTKELTSRPAISVELLGASREVQAKVMPVVASLEAEIGHSVRMNTSEMRDGDERKVYVTIRVV